MFKKLLLAMLILIVVGAAGTSVYNVLSAPVPASTIDPQSLQAESDALESAAIDEQAAGTGALTSESAGNLSVEVESSHPTATADAAVAASQGVTEARSATGQGNGSNRGAGGARAAGASTDQSGATNQGSGNGGGNGRGGRWQGETGHGVQNGNAQPAPQNGLTEWQTLSGAASNIALPSFTLIASDGQAIPVELGNVNYVASLGLVIQDGDRVTVTGYWDPSGVFAVGQITTASGATLSLRDDYGRPLWGGGKN